MGNRSHYIQWLYYYHLSPNTHIHRILVKFSSSNPMEYNLTVVNRITQILLLQIIKLRDYYFSIALLYKIKLMDALNVLFVQRYLKSNVFLKHIQFTLTSTQDV